MRPCYDVPDAERERDSRGVAHGNARPVVAFIISAAVLFALRGRAMVRYFCASMIAGVILFAIAALYRLLPVFLGYGEVQPDWFINVSPMAAMILCGAALLPKRLALTVPFAALLGTDLILNAYYGHPLFNVEFLAKTLAFAAIAAFGWQMRSHSRTSLLIPAAIGGSLFFYLVTNTASWLSDPGYVKNIAGWTQAMTTGLPQFQPTWMFYRNTFISDLVFTLLFVWCTRPATHLAAEEKQPAAAW
jgi:hypothetical protein